MPYSPLMVKPMKEELTSIGFTELLTVEDVDRADVPGTSGLTLLVINSVDGCAAGTARPGVRLALEEAPKRPDRLLTVFAGQDMEAAFRARSLFADIPPSEPSIAVFKDGELVYFIPRHRIESRDARAVAGDLTAVFKEFAE
ncbi:BrxA/BrxB family bacilliredoxin [Streptomyces sp. NPDC004549]|uniref:BrxA/BrxB family bacilliredoxin n=1 Tax=Streptomyces sp. NPDC004549 TaxID=3154283 RepID=UPI0033AAC5AE